MPCPLQATLTQRGFACALWVIGWMLVLCVSAVKSTQFNHCEFNSPQLAAG